MLLLLYPLTQATGTDAAAAASLAALGLSAPAGTASSYTNATASASLAALSLGAPAGFAYAPIDAIAQGALSGISLLAPMATAVGEYVTPPADRFNYGAAYNAKNLSHSMADPAVARAYLRTRRRRPW